MADYEVLNGIYAKARDQAIAERIEWQRKAAAAVRPAPSGRTYPPRTPESFYAEKLNHSDADMSFAVYARDRMGLSEPAVAAEIIRARTAIGEVGRKGARTASDLRRYARFTARKVFGDARYQRRSDEYER